MPGFQACTVFVDLHHGRFSNRYGPMGGGVVPHNLSIIPPAEHNFKHNTLLSRVTPESIILYFTSIILFIYLFNFIYTRVKTSGLKVSTKIALIILLKY